VKTVKTAVTKRLGFLAGEFAVPEDFNRMGRAEIEASNVEEDQLSA
jgi:hypothetical protein